MVEPLNRGDTGLEAVGWEGLKDFLAEASVDGGATKAQAIFAAGGKITRAHITRRHVIRSWNRLSWTVTRWCLPGAWVRICPVGLAQRNPTKATFSPSSRPSAASIMRWLGAYRIKARKVRNATRHLGERLAAWRRGEISFAEFDASVQGWTNHRRYADTSGLRRHLFANLAQRGGPADDAVRRSQPGGHKIARGRSAHSYAADAVSSVISLQ
jgi:hypothetical protein